QAPVRPDHDDVWLGVRGRDRMQHDLDSRCRIGVARELADHLSPPDRTVTGYIAAACARQNAARAGPDSANAGSLPPMSMTYEDALQNRVAEMVDACTRCGKCVEACPITDAAGVTASPREVIDGVIDIVRQRDGNEAARRWASSCVLSGECIKACD